MTNWGYTKIRYITKAEDNSTTEQGTLVGVDTPLDIISIAL